MITLARRPAARNEFEYRQPEDVTVHGCHSAQFPVLGVQLDGPVYVLYLGDGPLEQLGLRIPGLCRDARFISPKRTEDFPFRQLANVQLIQHLEGAFARNRSQSHFD